MSLRKEITEAELIDQSSKRQKWYGIAYRKYDYRITVCYPIPLNLLIRLWYNIINHIKYPKGITKDDKVFWNLRKSILEELSETLDRKWELGYLKGFNECKMQIEEFASIQEKAHSQWILNTIKKMQNTITEMQEYQKGKDD